MRLSFLVEELAFKDYAEGREFICDKGGEAFILQKPLPTPAEWLDTSKVGVVFETAKAAAFRKVDIKGQI